MVINVMVTGWNNAKFVFPIESNLSVSGIQEGYQKGVQILGIDIVGVVIDGNQFTGEQFQLYEDAGCDPSVFLFRDQEFITVGEYQYLYLFDYKFLPIHWQVLRPCR